MLCFCLQCLCAWSLHCICFLPQSFHCHCCCTFDYLTPPHFWRLGPGLTPSVIGQIHNTETWVPRTNHQSPNAKLQVPRAKLQETIINHRSSMSRAKFQGPITNHHTSTSRAETMCRSLKLLLTLRSDASFRGSGLGLTDCIICYV